MEACTASISQFLFWDGEEANASISEGPLGVLMQRLLEVWKCPDCPNVQLLVVVAYRS